MSRFLQRLLLTLTLAAFAAGIVLLSVARDPWYSLQAWSSGHRFWAYDVLITEAGARRGLDPMLVKAIVWRESAFQPEKVGTSGERGLMQVGEAAASDWAKAEKIETFVPTDLFDAKTNLDAGTWYFRKALERWKAKENPLPFALAEYNAGRGRVDRWIAETKLGEKATAEDLLSAIDFPLTRRYIEDITRRYRTYQASGKL